MAKSKRRQKNHKRIAGRGRADLNNGHLNPRSIRFGLSQGRFTMDPGSPPEPPPEWRPWKRDRFSLKIKAAHAFLRGKELDEIGPLIGKGRVGIDITRQLISQMVGQGMQFLMARGFVKAAQERQARS